MMKKKKPALVPLSAAQREIMDIVWEGDEVTVADVWEVLSERRSVARNTVQTVLVRMEEKGWLRHRSIGRTFLYSSALPRKVTLSQTVQNLLDAAFGGSAEELVTALLEDRSLGKDEAERIRAMIDEAEYRKRQSKSGRNS